MPDYKEVMSVLWRHSVEYIVVGGVSAALNGAPIVTIDIDIVHARSSANISRLMGALAELDAAYRDPGGRLIRPNESHLASPGHQLLKTRFGRRNYGETIAHLTAPTRPSGPARHNWSEST